MGLSSYINQNIEDIKNLKNHLEEEYKAGNISVRTYNELKANYEAKMGEMERDLSEAKAKDAFREKESRHVSEDIKNLKNKIAILEETQTDAPVHVAQRPVHDNTFQQSVVNVQSKLLSSMQRPEKTQQSISILKEDEVKIDNETEEKIKDELEQENVIEEVEKSIKDMNRKKNSKLQELAAIKSLFHRKHKEEKKEDKQQEQLPSPEERLKPEATETVSQAMTAETQVVSETEKNIQEDLIQQPETQQQTETQEIQPAAVEEVATAEEPKQEEKKEGHRILGKLFGHKEESGEDKKEEKHEKEDKKEKKTEEQAPQTVAETAQNAEAAVDEKNTGKPVDLTLELEKIKVVLDTIRETKKASDDTLANIFESIGELRSVGFQNDGSIKETIAKMEKIEDDVSDINPTAFTKKLNDINNTLEKHNMLLEKLDAKGNDLSEKINQAHTLLKTIGGIENLVSLNKELQQKVTDINDVTKYIERISVKAEKTYIDLNERLSDFVLYKSKQEVQEENVKDLIKAIDRVNLGFENYMSKKDMDTLNQDIALMKTQVQELGKALPIIQLKTPESITNLKKEKDDITMLMASLREEKDRGKITEKEYKKIVKSNEQKLKKIDLQLEKEWKNIGKYMSKQGSEPEQTEASPRPEPAPQQTQSAPPVPVQQPQQPPAQQSVSLLAPAPAAEEVKIPKEDKKPRKKKKKKEEE